MKRIYKIKDKKSVTLSDYFNYYRGKRLKKSDRIPGEIPLVTAGHQNQGIATRISNPYKIFDNAITIDMFGNCFWRPYEFVCDDNVIVLKHKKLNNQTAQYFVSTIKKNIEYYHYNKQYRLKDLKKHVMDIPVKKEKIDYEVLSNISIFLSKLVDLETKLETELETEIEARKKQYQYYSNKLLDFSDGFVGVPIIDKLLAELCPNGVTKMKLGTIANYTNGKGHEKNVTQDGRYTLITSKFISTDGKVKRYCSDRFTPIESGEIAMVLSDLPNGKALAKCFLVNQDGKFTVNQRICKLSPDNNVIRPKYLYYVLNRHKGLLFYDSGVGQTNLSRSQVESLELFVPPFEVQNEIIKILDNLDNYITSISQELSAEIANRRKQYEYYRNKLITF
ncbi:MAG: restriction endonuclease subunit S [bacterium]